MSKKKTTPKKDKIDEPGGVLPKVELIAIFIFFLSFTIWAMSKCSSTQAQYEQEASADASQTTSATTTIEKPVTETTEAPTTETVKQPKAPIKAPPEKVTVLYVVLDGLKLRKGPHLDSAIVRTLKLDSEVYFLNEVTNFKQEINLGDRLAIEPWVKVRVYTGHEGWVYGAGINYFKPKTITDTISN